MFVLYTLLIWLCYFYHFYITFYCFQFTEHLSFFAGMVMFVGGTFAVIVPTPNGAGPWHFAVITMMMLYGVNATDAGVFALIVHGIQTLLVIVLGIYGSLHWHWRIGQRNRRFLWWVPILSLLVLEDRDSTYREYSFKKYCNTSLQVLQYFLISTEA